MISRFITLPLCLFPYAPKRSNIALNSISLRDEINYLPILLISPANNLKKNIVFSLLSGGLVSFFYFFCCCWVFLFIIFLAAHLCLFLSFTQAFKALTTQLKWTKEKKKTPIQNQTATNSGEILIRKYSWIFFKSSKEKKIIFLSKSKNNINENNKYYSPHCCRENI